MPTNVKPEKFYVVAPIPFVDVDGTRGPYQKVENFDERTLAFAAANKHGNGALVVSEEELTALVPLLQKAPHTLEFLAARMGLKVFDYSLPQAWFDHYVKVMGERPSMCVWSYDINPSHAIGLTEVAAARLRLFEKFKTYKYRVNIPKVFGEPLFSNDLNDVIEMVKEYGAKGISVTTLN